MDDVVQNILDAQSIQYASDYLIIWIPELPKISLKTRLLSLLLQVLEGRGGRCGRRTPRGPWRSAKFLANRKFFLQKKDK